MNQEYLTNPICKLTPLFTVDYTKKQNIVSACFFKMDSGGYKSFSRYTKGLANLSILVKQVLSGFRIRLFIDNTIYKDDSLMADIRKLDNVDCVLYHCPNFIEIKAGQEFHLGIFGMFVRYMTMFDFPNNDANHVIVFDIDVIDPKINIKDYSRLNGYNKVMKLYSNLDDTYLVISGRLFHVNIKHKKIIYNNKFITPYVISPKIINFKKIPNKIFSNFLFHIHKTETKYLNYEITEDVAAKKCSKYICFGVDEYFINNVVIPYLIKHKMPILIRYSYHIMQPFFFYTKTQETKDKFDYHIQQLLAGIKYSGDPIKFLDRIFYDRQNNPIEKLKPIATKIVNNYYNLIQQLYTQHDYSIIGKDFILLSLSKNIYGSVYISKYTSYFNPERPSLIQTQIRVNNIQPLDPKIAKNKLITQIIS